MSEKKEAKWITSFDEIATASNASLRRALVTCDGRGVKLKEAALDELIRRWSNTGDYLFP